MLKVAEVFHGSHTGRQRRANEDSLYARSPLFAIADGMGGAQAGEIASGIAVETLGAGVSDADPARPAEERLADVVRTANGRIYEMARTDESRAGMGTTMTVLLVGEEEVTIAHVGDSRAYRLRSGELERLTDDHSLVEEFLRQGKLTEEEARNHPQRSVITRALGPDSRVEVDTSTWPGRSGDVFLLCSDGLTTMVQEPRISEILQASPSLDAAGRELIDAANAAGGRDNISVVLVRLGEVEVALGAAHVADQETSAGRPGDARTEDVRAAAAAVSTVDADPPTTARRLTPIEPPPAQQRPRKRRSPWPRRLLVTGGVLLFFGVPVALGGLLALRSVYFVGSDEQGFVTIYRGLPYELPLDVRLYQRNYTSGISREVVPESRREVISAHELRSRDDAYDYVRQLERGQVVER